MVVCCKMMHVAHSYSAWLAIWTMLVALGMRYPPPPTMTLMVAALFTVTTSLFLPQFDIRVGFGSARRSLRVTAVAIEVGMLLLAIYMNHRNGSGTSQIVSVESVMSQAMSVDSVTSQVVLAAVYIAYMHISGVGVMDHYTRVLTQASAGRTPLEYVRARINRVFP
jgi:hypothetical protein